MNSKERAANYMKLKNGYKMKQTAVEWLQEEIKHIIPNDFLNKFEKAKEMEKQQLIEAHLDGQWLSTTVEEIDYAEQYYNETFKK